MIAPRIISGPATPGMSAEDTIALPVIHQVLPALEDLLFVLARLQAVWNTPQNGVPEKIVSAAKAEQPLAGYSAFDFARWGGALKGLEVFLKTPIKIELPDGSTETVTPESVLLTKYTPMEVTQ